MKKIFYTLLLVCPILFLSSCEQEKEISNNCKLCNLDFQFLNGYYADSIFTNGNLQSFEDYINGSYPYSTITEICQPLLSEVENMNFEIDIDNNGSSDWNIYYVCQ